MGNFGQGGGILTIRTEGEDSRSCEGCSGGLVKARGDRRGRLGEWSRGQLSDACRMCA